MIRDEDVVRLATSRGQYLPGRETGRFTFLFDAAAYSPDDWRRATPCTLAVPLPSSRDPKPWLLLPPDDAEEYLDQLDAFVEDEVRAGCLLWGRQEREGGVRILHLAPYGLERLNRAEHERLLLEVRPDEWPELEAD